MVANRYHSGMDLNSYLSVSETAAKFARRLDLPAALVSQWRTKSRPIPAERCPAIETATHGEVTRRDLRPDDWWLIWPELVTEDHPAPAAVDASFAPNSEARAA